MKKILLWVTQFVLLAFVSGVMAIQKPSLDPAPPAPASTEKPILERTEKFFGMIQMVDEVGKTIIVKGKMVQGEKTMTFAFDEKTKITMGKAPMTIRDLRKDMQVSIVYRQEMDKMIAEGLDDIQSGDTIEGEEAFRQLRAYSADRRRQRA